MIQFVIFPHQNLILKIREFQDSLCDFLASKNILHVPSFPIMIQTENQNELNEKSEINSLFLDEQDKGDFIKTFYKANEKLCLKIKINEKKGEIALVQILKDSKTITQNNENDKIFDENEFSKKLQELSSKKISPFKLCKLEIERTEKSSKWKILSEKWKKQ